LTTACCSHAQGSNLGIGAPGGGPKPRPTHL
jgi:hypothetical protein